MNPTRANIYTNANDMSKNNKLEPKDEELGMSLVEPKDHVSVKLLGGVSHKGLAITRDQAANLARWLEIDPKDVLERKDDDGTKRLEKAGNWRNVSRHAEHHGMRLIAFLAGRRLLENGKDPVESLAEMLYEYLEQPYRESDEE